MWTFACVRTAVVDNSAATCEAFVADLTGVGTFSWFYMFHPRVRLEFGFGFKSSWALSARKGLRIPHVSRVVVYLQKCEEKKKLCSSSGNVKFLTILYKQQLTI